MIVTLEEGQFANPGLVAARISGCPAVVTSPTSISIFTGYVTHQEVACTDDDDTS